MIGAYESLKDRTCLITGGASGIGREAARFLARAGAKVVVSDVDDEATSTVVDVILTDGGMAWPLHLDVSDESDWAKAALFLEARLGKLDVLVNNAAVGTSAALLDTDLPAWRHVLSINLDGTFLGMRTCMPLLVRTAQARDGLASIINISSVVGLVGKADGAAYSASKFAIRGLTKSLVLEAATNGWPVRINTVHPGYIDTPFLENGLKVRAQKTGTSPEDQMNEILRKHPIGRLGTEADIANAILFLSSDGSSFMTGSELIVDGGYLAQ